MGFKKSTYETLPVKYSTGADIERVCKEMGMSVTLMARELGLHPVTMFDYIAGRSEPKRATMIALQWVQETYAARKEALDAGEF